MVDRIHKEVIQSPLMIVLNTLAEGVTETENNEEPDIMRSEIGSAVENLNNGKSAGFDNIPDELLKDGGDEIIGALHKICNSVW